MRLRENLEREQQKQLKPKAKRPKASVVSHGSFVPMLTVWGAALFGLAVLVLPGTLIARMSMLTGLGSLGGSTKFVFAAIAAAFGAGLAFVVAAAIREARRTDSDDVPVISAVTQRRVRPIDPAKDLGSESLDAPIEDMPFTAEDDELLLVEAADQPAEPSPEPAAEPAKPQPTLGELAKRGYEIEEPRDLAEEESEPPIFTRRHFKDALIESCEGETCEAAATEKPEPARPLAVKAKAADTKRPARQPIGRPGAGGAWSLTQFEPEPKARPEPAREKPRELELEEFAELPGRNAVWVEDDGAARASKTRVQRKPVPASALEKLRQTPAEELSLVEMVERFAAALHDHQQAERASLPASGTRRDAALAEALKALTLFTERGFDQRGVASEASDLTETERELRDALTKLQTLRGAA